MVYASGWPRMLGLSISYVDLYPVALPGEPCSRALFFKNAQAEGGGSKK